MKISLTVFLLLSVAFGFAQVENPDSLRATVFELRVKTVPPDSLILPFGTIKIIDSRPDTSKLGYRVTHGYSEGFGERMNFKKILLKPGIAEGIENFVNAYYKHNFTANGKVLLISMRKLWINNMPNRPGEPQRSLIYLLSHANIYAKFEYYISSVNGYVPLKRIDTLFQLTPDNKIEDYDPKDENKLPFFCFVLERMIENVNYDLYIKGMHGKKEMSLQDIAAYNAESENIPILNEPINKGVFLTFNEFKNNRPSVISFSKRKIPKEKIYEIVDEKNNVIIDYFAYYDGEKLAKAKSLASLYDTRFLAGLFGHNISQDNYGIYRVNKSFQFFENYIQYLPSNSPGGTPTPTFVRVPRQIDFDTGEVY